MQLSISVTIFGTCSIHSIGMYACYVAIFSNAETFRCLYRSCMPSSPKGYNYNNKPLILLIAGHMTSDQPDTSKTVH